MTESQIACFEAVAQYGSFSQAAKQLLISQPAVSHQVSKLEHELGFLLLDRTGRKITLTNGGSVMLDFFMQARSDFAEAIKSAQEVQNAADGEIRLGFPDGWEFSAFDAMLTQFQSRFPRIRVELINIPLGRMEAEILDGTIDAAIAMQYTVHSSRKIVNHQLMNVHHVLVYSVRFDLPKDRPATLADFRDSTFYLATADNPEPFEQSVIRECGRYGFTPKMVNCSNLTTAMFYVRSNQGVFLGSELAVRNLSPDQYARLDLNDIQQPVLLAWRAGTTSTAVNLFLNETLYRDKIISPDTRKERSE